MGWQVFSVAFRVPV